MDVDTGNRYDTANKYVFLNNRIQNTMNKHESLVMHPYIKHRKLYTRKLLLEAEIK